MLGALLSLLLLLGIALGCGALLIGKRDAGTPIIPWAGTACLTGLCAAAFWLHTVGILKVPFAIMGGLLLLAAIAGWVRLCRAPSVRSAGGAMWKHEAAALLPVLLLASTPFILCASGPSMAYDTVGCWWPAGLEVAEAGTTPDPVSDQRFRLRPEYARGLAWLYVLGGAGEAPDARFLRLVTLIFWPLTALVLMDFGWRRGEPGMGWMAGVLVLALPELASQAASGLGDVPVGAAAALCGVGLTLSRESSSGLRMAILGALGAATFKDEGFVVWAATSGVLLWRALRGQLRGQTLWTGLSLALTFLGLWWRSQAESSALRPSALGAIRVMGHEPGFLIGRLHDLPGTTLDRLTAHWRGIGGFVENTPDGSWAIVFVLIFTMLVLVPRGSRGGVSVAPALILLLALGAAVVVNPLALDHQLDSSVDRFLAQVLPLLVLAACARLLGSHSPAKTETPSTSMP